MTALSPRFAIAAAALILLSAVPVWFHVATEPTFEDCADPDSFFRASKIGGATMRAPRKPNRTSFAVRGRKYARSPSPLDVSIFRTFMSSRFYASPMSFGFDSMAYVIPRDVRRIEVDGDILPVHWSWFEIEGKVHLETYLYVQGGRPVVHPLESGLRTAVSQLLDGTYPLTVMIASAEGDAEEGPEFERTALAWFEQTWREMKASCGS